MDRGHARAKERHVVPVRCCDRSAAPPKCSSCTNFVLRSCKPGRGSQWLIHVFIGGRVEKLRSASAGAFGRFTRSIYRGGRAQSRAPRRGGFRRIGALAIVTVLTFAA